MESFKILKPKFYTDKYVKCLVCEKWYWRHWSPPHHLLRRNQMTAAEISDSRFFIDLCQQHHAEVERDRTKSGIRFYLFYKILDYCINHIGKDNRFVNWAECKRIKLNV